MGRYVAGCAPEMDELVDAVAWGIGRQIEAMRIPRLRGVVLGGGYARGEGGVREVDGHQTLSIDLDFYVVAEDGSSDAELAAIGDMLAPVSESWTRKVGVDVDFCPAKTHWRMKHDRERVMIQELLHEYFDVAGEKGEILFYQVTAGGRRIQVMGSLGLDPAVDYPTGADALILPSQGRSDLAECGWPLVARLRPKAVYLDHYDNSFPPLTAAIDPQPFIDRLTARGIPCRALEPFTTIEL